MQNFISIFEVILVTVSILLGVAFLTVAERKTMASMQRRVGPNIVGAYGLLQAFADALKLILKEYLVPTQANKKLFTIGPLITLIFALLSYSVMPFSTDLAIGDLDIGILAVLSFSGMSGYGVLLAGWSSNSKYSFLGSLRSTAQLLSYELILSTAVIAVVLINSSLNLVINVESQKAVFSLLPLLPIFVMFFISAVAETNRAPFDLAEAESELVSGHMTEYSGVLFVFFFLAEYSSILLICFFTCALFLGGYLNGLEWMVEPAADYECVLSSDYFENIKYPVENITDSFTTSTKVNILLGMFILIRASVPRMRFDALMVFNWLDLLPIIIGLIALILCFMTCFDISSCVALDKGYTIEEILEAIGYKKSLGNSINDKSIDEIKKDVEKHEERLFKEIGARFYSDAKGPRWIKEITPSRFFVIDVAANKMCYWQELLGNLVQDGKYPGNWTKFPSIDEVKIRIDQLQNFAESFSQTYGNMGSNELGLNNYGFNLLEWLSHNLISAHLKTKDMFDYRMGELSTEALAKGITDGTNVPYEKIFGQVEDAYKSLIAQNPATIAEKRIESSLLDIKEPIDNKRGDIEIKLIKHNPNIGNDIIKPSPEIRAYSINKLAQYWAFVENRGPHPEASDSDKEDWAFKNTFTDKEREDYVFGLWTNEHTWNDPQPNAVPSNPQPNAELDNPQPNAVPSNPQPNAELDNSQSNAESSKKRKVHFELDEEPSKKRKAHFELDEEPSAKRITKWTKPPIIQSPAKSQDHMAAMERGWNPNENSLNVSAPETQQSQGHSAAMERGWNPNEDSVNVQQPRKLTDIISENNAFSKGKAKDNIDPLDKGKGRADWW